MRTDVPLPDPGTWLQAEQLVTQLQTYDPGSLLRCAVQDDPAYRTAIDTVGGVSWGYPVRFLEDLSKPRFLLGPELPELAYPEAETGAAAPTPVVIEKADIVGTSETAALFYSQQHGLMLVDLSKESPSFTCAAKLPGDVRDFYYYEGHLVVMAGAYLLHFKVDGVNLSFLELVQLDGQVLDTRRFNDRLVIYSMAMEDAPMPTPNTPGGGIAVAEPVYAGDYRASNQHRALRVFKFGDKLSEELHDSLRDTSPNTEYLSSGAVDKSTPFGTVVATGSSFGDALWASDHYFVVTESIESTKLTGWSTFYYSVCTQSHTNKVSERVCATTYETRPNPDYTPPDNSGGDRACKGTTLSDCLHEVARVSNPTIQVPVGVKCADQTFDEWICDAYESRSDTYPTFTTDESTRLTIFEYTDASFVRLDSKVHEITTPGLDQLQPTDQVGVITTSAQAYDLSVPGRLQTLYFQDGYLYAIADGVLQVYSMGDGSLVRTSSQQVLDSGTLQTALFSERELYLSDYSYDQGNGDHSTLRVFDLSNPAFPKQASQDRTLPGGHAAIFPTSLGILTAGQVSDFEGNGVNALKLGLFADPFTTEKAYLILGTDLTDPAMGETEALYFDGTNERMFLPYVGTERNAPSLSRARVGVSHLVDDEIVSEGALHLPEAVDRVRPRPGVDAQMLSFGQSSIALLTPAGREWTATSVLSYYTPTSLYRVSDQDDYVEVLRLGTSCRLHFARASQLDVRDEASMSAPFDCGTGYEWAYANNIVFSATTGVSFDSNKQVTALSADEITDLTTKSGERETCLFSDKPTNDPVDYAHLPSAANLKCYTPEAYQMLLQHPAVDGGA